MTGTRLTRIRWKLRGKLKNLFLTILSLAVVVQINAQEEDFRTAAVLKGDNTTPEIIESQLLLSDQQFESIRIDNQQPTEMKRFLIEH